MEKHHKEYVADDRMRDLLADNNLLLLVLSRFAIPFGFGDAKVADICRDNGVDCATFLAVANFISFRSTTNSDLSLDHLMGYLRRAHAYFLNFMLPSIRRTLIEAINTSDATDAGFLILRFYDDYVAEVRNHMEHENDSVFAHVESMLAGNLPDNYSRIERYSAGHTGIVEKLKELKDIVIYHYRHASNDLLNHALYDINNCEADLLSHCEVEDRLFVPAARRLEQHMAQRRGAAEDKTAATDAEIPDADSLSTREKEIIACIARGMASKEIADHLRLSVHTVTTYRRNIASKLGIHSPAGLTIFAIIHKLVDIKDLKLTS